MFKVYYLIFQLIKGFDLNFFDKVRSKLVRLLTKSEVSGLFVRAQVSIFDFSNLHLGEHVSINHGCFLSCFGGLTIGDFVAIGHNTSILTTEHGFSEANTPIKYQPVVMKPVRIGNNVWIGANCTILSGVSIADNTIIAAGAVVKRSITESGSIVGGVPAKFLKHHDVKL